MKMNRFLASLIAMLGFLGAAGAAEHTKDTLEQVKKAVEGGKAILVDVREESEWNDGHLKIAKHVPLSQIKAGIEKEKLEKKLPAGSVLYLHCASGKRCLAAADLLKKQGYDVRPLKDGYANLLKAGFEGK